ncbi:MAG: hypothetical protein DHS20C18_41050 [Saprospiraceae bacterium]|nr:MAG: hypothetical protein DHS20C18_41050 [Saprospiraceae bacterium]
MNRNKTILAIVGFLLAGTGFLALVLSLVSVQLSFLTWIDIPGRLFGFIVRLMMIIIGMAMIYLNLTDFSKEEI